MNEQQRSRRNFLIIAGGTAALVGCKSDGVATTDAATVPDASSMGADVAVTPVDTRPLADAAAPDAAGTMTDVASPRLDVALPGPDAASGPDAAPVQPDASMGGDASAPDAGSAGNDSQMALADAEASPDTTISPKLDTGTGGVEAGMMVPDAGPSSDTNVMPDPNSGVGNLVLEFNGNNQHINHGNFFPQGVDLGGTFWWEAWVKASENIPNNAAVGYIVSDGFGGAHGLLWGFLGGGGEAGSTSGNIYLTNTGQPFDADDGVGLGEWVHVAVGGDGQYIRTYVNGVASGETALKGARRTPNPNSGSGILFVGGSEHLNFHGRIAWLRAWDNNISPRANPELAFIPDRRPTVTMGSEPGSPPCEFLADYTHPQWIVRDLSPGGCRGQRHPGVLFNASLGVNQAGGYNGTPDSLPLPRWVKDEDCPAFYADEPPPAKEKEQKPTFPVDIGYVWDSFGRKNQTYAFQKVPTLGATEGGSEHPQTWKTSASGNPKKPSSWGLLNGFAVYLGDAEPGLAWVDTKVTDYKVTVIGRKSPWNPGLTGACFRLKDEKNFRAITTNRDNTFTTHLVVNGVAQPFEGETQTKFSFPTGDSQRLAIICKGETITVRANDVDVKVFTGQKALADGTHTGLASPKSSFARWLVFHAEPIKGG